MNKKLFFGVIAVLLLAVPAMAVKPYSKADWNGFSHPGQKNQLYFYEKDSNWEPVVGGAWGKMTFDTESFVFNGHGLEVGWDYTLIYYGDETHNDEWPYATCMASGTANEDGDIHLMGSMKNPFDDTLYEKIWLVLSSDVDCVAGEMTGWTPAEYLFEYNGL